MADGLGWSRASRYPSTSRSASRPQLDFAAFAPGPSHLGQHFLASLCGIKRDILLETRLAGYCVLAAWQPAYTSHIGVQVHNRAVSFLAWALSLFLVLILSLPRTSVLLMARDNDIQTQMSGDMLNSG